MKKLTLLFGILMIFVLSAYSQSEDKTITLKKKNYYQSGQKLNGKQLKTILSTNPASSSEYEKYRVNNSVGTPLLIGGSICALAGGAIALSSSIKESNDINNGELSGDYPTGIGLAALGLGLVLVAVPFMLPANKHFKKSVDLYNSNLKTTGYYQVRFNLMVKGNGLGIRVQF
jgi:hypothetical protein